MRHQQVGDTGTNLGKGQGESRGRVIGILTDSRFVHRIGFRRARARARARWPFELRRCRSSIEAVHGNLQTNVPDSYAGSLRVRKELRTIRAIALELKALLKASCRAPACPTLDNRLESRRQTLDPKTRACPRSLARLAADAASPIPSPYPT